MQLGIGRSIDSVSAVSFEAGKQSKQDRRLIEFPDFDEIIDYFAMLDMEDSTHPESGRGVRMTCAVRDMVSRPPDQALFEQLLTELEATTSLPGSQYFFLWSWFVGWARESGLRAPTTHPWAVDTKKYRCIDAKTYELTQGAEYLPTHFDDEKRQLKVRNDKGRTRWYPYECFEQNIRPRREWGPK